MKPLLPPPPPPPSTPPACISDPRAANAKCEHDIPKWVKEAILSPHDIP